ncbi:MAG: 3-deoxy-manno-octulosonate cytidylyltransferase [Clostridium sp.]|nr:3-deoxy-manno-octulosonate cytidylyltransferase [Prevotella sp.]MCM1428205.1 3-deoxy-manno-octulosonate cytidylyltransferase [Clostridium sp.]MCM1475936.1 3-deoxy-manno-octulosonate cytidylyltransferase [Muribaculaceae bacterium]
MKVIAIIPARYASTRFPGKPLAMLGGKSVIERVCRQVEAAGIRPVVATDDERILEAVKVSGYEAVMTSASHRSGTDRIREALDKIEGAEGVDVIINVQGDEPFIRPEQLTALTETFADGRVEIATLVKRYDPKRGIEGVKDPNLVKVVTADNGDALYFSRSLIPYMRGVEEAEWAQKHDYLTHIGVYAFRPMTLRAVTALPEGGLEKIEKLEQLRWLQAGYRIRSVLTEGETIGIDTPADLAAAESRLRD